MHKVVTRSATTFRFFAGAAAAVAAISAVAQIGVPSAVAQPADSGGCADVQIIKVRGTNEPQSGSFLLTPLASQIARDGTNRATVELEYPATRAAESVSKGVDNLVLLLNTLGATCPNQQVVLLGYSQGARVITEVLGSTRVSNDAAARIEGIALFGDPTFTGTDPYNRGDFDPKLSGLHPRPEGSLATYADRLRDYCNAGDKVCQGGDPNATQFENGLSSGHLMYFVNDTRNKAVTFLRGRLW
ncbi:cutinase family protein [Nocardia sp. NPDC051463]|uniref:cutinase family protein n=1 Tax=Nocardia sp. NPDC051463 TaxID=3154845 RepID=UPI00344EAA40